MPVHAYYSAEFHCIPPSELASVAIWRTRSVDASRFRRPLRFESSRWLERAELPVGPFAVVAAAVNSRL